MLYRRLRDAYRRLWVIPKLHRTYGKLTAADAFSRIYESSLWFPDGRSELRFECELHWDWS